MTEDGGTDIATVAGRPKISDIQRAVAQHFQMGLNELCSQRRWPEVVLARQTAMFLCRKLTRKSLPVIGRMFGGYDHSTVWHATKKLETRMQTDIALTADVHRLMIVVSGKGFAFRHGHGHFDALDASLNTIGLELAIVPIGTRDTNGFAGVPAADQNRLLEQEVQP